jgi:hypothetical protein
MSNILIVGYTTEGNTDVRFLESVIRRTFEEIAFGCEGLIDIHSVIHIPTQKRKYHEEIRIAAQKAFEIGVMTLCLHTDADDSSDWNAFESRINPALSGVVNERNNICKVLVPLVPIYMTEAWILADVDLLISEIGTGKTVTELGLNKDPESVADPKGLIEDAIRIAFADTTRRQRKRIIKIDELYQLIGQKINLTKMHKLSSYIKFRKAVENAYISLNFFHK